MNIRDFFWFYVDIWAETNKGSPETYDQCIDLWRAYNRKIIQAPDIFGNPPDIWANYQKDYYDKILNDSIDKVPQLGDVIIWDKSYGGVGHIAISTELVTKKEFTSFDQNDPIGEACHFQPHTYSKVLGWLRPKNQEAILGKPEPAPPSVDIGTDQQIQGYKRFIDDLEAILRPPEDKRDFAGLLGVVAEMKSLAGSYTALKKEDEKFVKDVAGYLGSASETKTSIIETLQEKKAPEVKKYIRNLSLFQLLKLYFTKDGGETK